MRALLECCHIEMENSQYRIRILLFSRKNLFDFNRSLFTISSCQLRYKVYAVFYELCIGTPMSLKVLYGFCLYIIVGRKHAISSKSLSSMNKIKFYINANRRYKTLTVPVLKILYCYLLLNFMFETRFHCVSLFNCLFTCTPNFVLCTM